MNKVFIYIKGDYLMEYQTNVIPRIGEVIIYQNKSYQVLNVDHIVVKDIQNGSYLGTIDIGVVCLD